MSEENYNINDDDFVVYINKVVKKHGGDSVANNLRVSIPTIIRWVQGRNLPMQSLRGSILKAYPINELD